MSESGAASISKKMSLEPTSYLLLESPDGTGVEIPPSEETAAEEGNGGTRTVFIVVALSGDARTGIERLEAAHGRPDEIHLVLPKDAAGASVDDPMVCVSRVDGPGDLTGISMRVGSALADTEGDDVYVYLDDLTCLLQYVDTRKAYRFVNTLSGRIQGSDAVGYFEMTPGAHDERTYAVLSTLFDEVIGDTEAVGDDLDG